MSVWGVRSYFVSVCGVRSYSIECMWSEKLLCVCVYGE